MENESEREPTRQSRLAKGLTATSVDRLVSHLFDRIRNPIAILRGYSHLFLDRKMGALDQRQRQALEAMARATEHLWDACEKVLAILLATSQHDSSEFSHRIEPYSNLQAALHVILQDLQERYPECKIASIITAPHEPVQTRLSPETLLLILRTAACQGLNVTDERNVRLVALTERLSDSLFIRLALEPVARETKTLSCESSFQCTSPETHRAASSDALLVCQVLLEAYGGSFQVPPDPNDRTIIEMIVPCVDGAGTRDDCEKTRP